jgi:tetratricopeptide (TPR) repeat protein
LCIMLAWFAAGIVERWPGAKRAVWISAVAACLCMAALTRVQIEYWQNSETLFRHALAVTSRNSVAHNNLGMALTGIPGRLPEAIAEYEAALEIQPDHAEARNNLGTALARVPGRMPDAIAQYQMALRIKPDYVEAHNNLGAALLETPGRIPGAIEQFQSALRSRPDYEEARNNLAIAFSRTPGRTADAVAQFKLALRLAPDDADAHYNLATVLARIPGRPCASGPTPRGQGNGWTTCAPLEVLLELRRCSYWMQAADCTDLFSRVQPGVLWFRYPSR